MERINKNLLLMNLHVIYYENLHEVMKTQMPSVKQVRSYCRVWAYGSMLPPNHNTPANWKDIECLQFNLSLAELKTARERAILESDPTIPTICLIETPPNFSPEESREDEIKIYPKISKEAAAKMEEVD